MTLVTPAHMMPGPPLAPPVVVKQPKLMEGVFVLDPTANNTDDEVQKCLYVFIFNFFNFPGFPGTVVLNWDVGPIQILR